MDPNGHSAHRWFPPPLHLLGLPIAVRRREESNRLIHKSIRKPTSERSLGLGLHDSGRRWIDPLLTAMVMLLPAMHRGVHNSLQPRQSIFIPVQPAPKGSPHTAVSKGISSVDSFDPKYKIIM